MTLDAEHVADYCREKYDERAAKLAYGICAGEKSSGTVGRVTAKGNRDRLKREYGVEYDDLADEAREYDPDVTVEDALEALDGQKGTLAQHARDDWQQRATESDESTSDEFIDRLDSYVQERGVDYGELVIMTESDSEYLERLEDSEDLCIARRDDVRAIESERDRLVGTVGIDSGDAESLSLDSLRQIAEKNSGVTDGERLSPAPRSGDPQASSDETRYADPEKAEAIQARLTTLEENSSGGPLVKHAIEHWERELAELEE